MSNRTGQCMTDQLEPLEEELNVLRQLQLYRQLTRVPDSAKKSKTNPQIMNFLEKSCSCGTYHPLVEGFEATNGPVCNYYAQIADRYPDLTMYIVLLAELKFLRADKHGNGVLDLEDVRNVIRALGRHDIPECMIEYSFKLVDKEKVGILDFGECLEILQYLESRNRSYFPSKSGCSIM